MKLTESIMNKLNESDRSLRDVLDDLEQDVVYTFDGINANFDSDDADKLLKGKKSIVLELAFQPSVEYYDQDADWEDIGNYEDEIQEDLDEIIEAIDSIEGCSVESVSGEVYDCTISVKLVGAQI